MTDWSEIFEQRLQTVLSAGPYEEEAQARETQKTAVFELTPPWSRDKDTGRDQQQQRGAQCDATAAFFNAIRRTQAGGNAVHGGVDGGSNAWNRSPEPWRHSSFGSALPRPTPATVMTPAGQVFGAVTQPPTSVYTSTPTPVSDAGRPIVQKLQESYSKRASDLHSEATQKLADVQQTLEAGLDSLARDENAFLARVAEKQAQFGQPADLWTVKIQVREAEDNGPQQTTRQTVKEKDERVVDRIATMRAAGATLETELARLWQEWGQAQNELAVVMRAIFGSGDGKACDKRAGDGGFDAILADAEAEMEAAAAEAVQAMRDNEKAFRKLILAEECKLAQAMLARQSKYD